jgi:TolA-binding protein
MGLVPRMHHVGSPCGTEGLSLAGLALLLLVVGVAGGGCADLMASDSLAQDVAQLQQDVSQLKLNLQRGRVDPEALGRLERASREQGSESARQMAALSARVESLSAELSRLAARLDQVSQRLEARARDVPAAGPSARRAEPPVPATPPPVPTPRPSPPATASAAPSTEGPTLDERYQAAYLDFSKGHYALAIPALRDYVRQFPDSPLADSAQCAVGESYLGLARASAAAGQADKAKQETEQAVQEFRKVLANYPRGSKVPTALYKEAVALTDLQQTALAQARLKYLLDHFPQSEEAPLAKERLAALSR